MGKIRRYGKHRYWTEEEIEKLQKLTKSKTKQQIADVLKRTPQSVECKMQRMGIEPFNARTDLLKAKDVGRLVGQHEKSIYNRWYKTGLPLKRVAKYRMISEKQLAKFMQEHTELWRASQCDEYFFGKYEWFNERLKAERKGIDIIHPYRKRKPWSPVELSRARMLHNKGLHYTEIAKELGRSNKAMYHVVRRFKEEGSLKNE